MSFLAKTAQALVALALIMGSWSRFQSSFSELETETIYRSNKQQRTVGSDDYDRALISLMKAVEINPSSSTYYAQTADLHLRKAAGLMRDGKIEIAMYAFEASSINAQKGLIRGPSDPYAWFMLAHSTQTIDGLSLEALSALEMSFSTGLAEGGLLVPRISLCFRYWSLLPQSLKDITRAQIELAMSNNNLRRSLAQYAASLPTDLRDDFLTLVEEAGSATPDHLRVFRYWLRMSVD